MKIVLQVVKNASVIIEEKLYSSIEKGYLLLVSFKEGDNEEIAEKNVYHCNGYSLYACYVPCL